MKTPDAIKAVMSAMCTAVGLSFVRAEQDGPRPKGIFLSYKIISQEGEPSWQNSREIIEDPADAEVAVIRTKAKSSLSVSCTILAPAASYSTAWSKGMMCLAWLESENALSVFETQGVIPKFVPVAIQDRAAFLETGFETRLGFDVVFTGVSTSEVDEDAVDIEETINNLPEA